MELRYIQLPCGVVNNRVKEKKIHLNLLPNNKKHVLFDQLSHSVHLENPTNWDVVSNRINDKETLQKYLLATGILKCSIQDSLDIIVGDDGKLSDAAVCRQYLVWWKKQTLSLMFLKILQNLTHKIQ